MFKHKDYIYMVYKMKSFSKAAETLYISQPALSAIIKKVEKEIGIQIFNRSTNPITLTKEGEFYIKSIEEIMEIEKNTIKHFENLKTENNLNIASSSFFCVYILPFFIENFSKTYPSTTIKLMENTSEVLFKNLETEKIDLGIDIADNCPSNLFSIDWYDEEILLAVPSNFKINKKIKDFQIDFSLIKSGKFLDKIYPTVDLKLFSDENFILLGKGHDLNEKSIKMCESSGFSPKVVMYADQLLTSYYMSKLGKGISFVRDSIPKYEEKTDKLIFYKIDSPLAKRKVKLFYKKENSSSTLKNFINFLLSEKC